MSKASFEKGGLFELWGKSLKEVFVKIGKNPCKKTK